MSKFSTATPHSVFMDAVLRLLSIRGPMATSELHPEVQRIHPSLCDDEEDRVINGINFGKKWKHAVRSAQAYLKKYGQIELRDGKWYLIKF